MATPFVTLTDISDLLGRDVTSDAGATAALSAACAICRSEAQQEFNAGTATIYLDGSGTDALVLAQAPATVGTVAISGSTITDYTTTADGLLLRGSAGSTPRPVWPRGRQNVQVTYSYGYADLTVPEDVCAVATDLTIRTIVQGPAQSETVGDVSISYGVPNARDLTENERRILRRYRGTRSF